MLTAMGRFDELSADETLRLIVQVMEPLFAVQGMARACHTKTDQTGKDAFDRGYHDWRMRAKERRAHNPQRIRFQGALPKLNPNWTKSSPECLMRYKNSTSLPQPTAAGT